MCPEPTMQVAMAASAGHAMLEDDDVTVVTSNNSPATTMSETSSVSLHHDFPPISHDIC